MDNSILALCAVIVALMALDFAAMQWGIDSRTRSGPERDW